MALSRIKTWIPGEVLSAADLNSEFNNIINNAASLFSPLTGSLNLAGYGVTMDAAGVTSFSSTAVTSWLFVSGSKSGTPGTTGTVENWGAQTFTDSNTAASGTAAAYVAHAIQRPTLAATNATVTTTDAATFYITNAPAAGTNETLTNAWAMWTDDGAIRHDLTNSKVSAAGATLRSLYLPAAIQTISGSTNITTAAGFNLIEIERPTMSAASVLTITNAATLYIQNAPLGGGAGPATITNAYALWVDDGIARFDGAVNLAVGANVASAATINLTTVAGNSCHVTGTTTITAVTLTTGKFVEVIFDGALTLTHHTTNNNLPGTANITTAANDRALYWSDGTTVYCVHYQKADGTAIVGVSGNNACDFRLTLTTVTPVTTADVTGATTIYCTPYKGKYIDLYDGTATWNRRSSAEFSIALGTLTNALCYDVFCYDNATVPTLEILAWTSATARATALVLQDGVLVKSGATTRRYLGTFFTTATTTTEDSAAKRFLWNYYNRVNKPMSKIEATATWTYTTATYRQANAATGNQLDIVNGYAEESIRVRVMGSANNSTNQVRHAVGIGLNSTTVDSATMTAPALTANTGVNQEGTPVAEYVGFPAIGRSGPYVWLEQTTASGTTTWNGTTGLYKIGMTAQWRC